MSDHDEPEMVHLPIPERPDGELDFDRIARSLLSWAWLKDRGETLTCYGRVGDEATGAFLAWYDGRGGIDVFELCLGNRFGASVFMALQALAPSQVRTIHLDTHPDAGDLP